jgi:hypothetical protein
MADFAEVADWYADCFTPSRSKSMTHNETQNHHIGRDFLLFGMISGAVAWTLFIVWTFFVQMMAIVRS